MKKPRFLLFLLLFLSSILTLAQSSRVSLSGTLLDQESGEALRYGRVSCPAQGVGATANVYGFFSLSLRPGPVCLVVLFPESVYGFGNPKTGRIQAFVGRIFPKDMPTGSARHI